MKTNNYLGKRDENRGIVLFFIIFLIVLIIVGVFSVVKTIEKNKEAEGITRIDEMASEIKKTPCDVSTFEIKEERLILKGVLNENINEYLLGDIQNIQLVLKDNDGDKYEYDLDYYISAKNIEFSSIKEDSTISEINLDDIENSDYFVFLRIKYNSPTSENGYRYEYYTLNNLTENNMLEYNNMKISFETAKRVTTFLAIIFE